MICAFSAAAMDIAAELRLRFADNPLFLLDNWASGSSAAVRFYDIGLT